YLDGKQVIDYDGPHGMGEKTASVDLTAGLHPIVVTYYNGTGDRGLDLKYAGPNVKKQPLPVAKLWSAGGENLHDAAVAALQAIPGHETEKFADYAKLLIAGRSRSAVVGALRRLPKQHWDKDQAQPLVDNLISYLTTLPASSRTSADAVETIALAKDLATLLPEQQSHAAGQRLDNLDVPVIAIGTVFERMIYDKEKIAVQAGKPVEFRFSNTDAMPHNFAIIQPGTLEEVGTLAEATARDADAMQRNYIPKSDKILLASRLLQSKESQTLTFEAPKEPGVYPYVCTYPGHWRRMYGALYVVENLDDYTTDPAAYLAAHPLPIKDDLLNLIGQSHDWKIDELLADVKKLPSGRSFEVGRTAFKTAACISCHRVDDSGPEIGPDIRTLTAEKLDPEAILHSVLLPSEKIDDKYRSYVFELTSGKVHTGMILEETADVVKVIENPLAKAQALVIKKDDIDTREQSPKSIMPEGVLSKLTREEILDLIAYIHAKGDKKHKVYQAGGHSHHGH
ncbi:MAG TPA: plastocyanin/azurin family copper-binding protein, partial [Pirellulales bacterium]